MDDHTGTRRRASATYRWLSALPVAMMFLTRLPGRGPDTGLAGAAVAFPVVGAIVGLLGGVAYWLAGAVGLPAPVSALIAVGTSVVVTGALHEDGLADTADGLAGSTPDAALRIMRDHRIGCYGVLALILSVALRVAALAALVDPIAVVSAMAAVAAASRAAMPVVMCLLSPASATGLAAAAGRPDALDLFVGLGIAGAMALLALGPAPTLALAGAMFVAVWSVATIARRRLGGYTGDVLGAVQQLAEIAGLLAIVAAM